MRRSTLEIWLGVAGAVHLALVIVASRLPLPARGDGHVDPPIEIAMVEDEPSPAPVAEEAPGEAPSSPARVSSIPAAAPEVAAASAEAAEAAPEVVTDARSDWSIATTTAAPAPDMLARHPILLPVMPETPHTPPPAAPARSRTGGLAEGLDDRDLARGLGRGGPVLSAVEEAARIPGETPPEGDAVYEVTVHKSGTVTVVVRNANDARGSWEALRDTIARSVSARHIALPSNADGMRFVIHVDARVQFPDGTRPADLGTKGVVSAGEIGKSPDYAGLSFTKVPMVGVYHRGKVCSAGVAAYPGYVAIGGGCSPENIGLPAQRIVHGRIESEERL